MAKGAEITESNKGKVIWKFFTKKMLIKI